MTRLPLIALGAALVAGAAWFLAAPDGPDPLLPGAAEAHESGEVDTSLVTEMSLGDADAPVTVIEYASFTCPHCRTFHQGPFEEIKANYIDSGQVHFIYREVYFDRFGLWAGMMARCGGEDRYFAIADLIYERQSDWIQGDAAAIAANLRQIGRTAGLNDEQIDACFNNAEKAEALVHVFEHNSEEHEITSTPSFIIDGTKHGNMSYDDFAAILDEKLAE